VISLISLTIPRRLRQDWRQEWESEFIHRERLLADWDRLDWRKKLDLLGRSTSAFWDALALQPRRLEDEMVQDLRFGFRMLIKNPGFTLLAVLTLALGIGANTAIFSWLDRALVRTLPVDQPNQLVAFVEDSTGVPAVFSYLKYADLRDGYPGKLGVAAYFQQPFNSSGEGHTERVIGQIVSGNYFTVLGVQPALGRFYLPEEDRTVGSHPVVVISHGLWRRRFGADPAILGRSIGLNGHQYAVIGITPSEFSGTTRGTVNDVYVPIMMTAQAAPQACRLDNRNCNWLQLIGRLDPGVTRQQAQAAVWSLLAGAASSVVGQTGDKVADQDKPILIDGSRGYTDRVKDLSLPLKLLMGVVAFVLLTACANVANLLLSRAAVRRKEIAIRLSMGASRWRVLRQLLVESTLLATLGGAVGLLFGYWFSGLLSSFQQQSNYVQRTFDAGLDGRTLAFTLVVSLLTGIAFSLAPALQTSKPDISAILKTEITLFRGPGRRWALRDVLVVTQVALSAIVLIGAGLCVKSLRNLQSIDPGFDPAKVVTASFDLSLNKYDEPRGRQFISQLVQRVAALPGIEAVSLARVVAFSDVGWIGPAVVDGQRPQPVIFNAVSPDYFRTIGTPLVNGRDFTGRDTADAPRVFIVNEALARRYWPGERAVGKQLNGGVVVGVAKNNKEKGLTADPRPAIYLPLQQKYVPDLTLHVRSAMVSPALISTLRREVHSLDAALPIYNLRTLAEQKDGSLYAERLAAAMLTLFGVLAVSLAAVGIYGVLSYAVTARTREMGIRLALGARPGDLRQVIVGHGMMLTLLGLAIGIGASLALTHLMKRLLFGVSTTDPATLALIPALLAVVALAACWVPARRATRMNPSVALRYE
jgi:predicted permease